LTHRGPDGQGVRTFDHAWLGHRLLAIVDFDAGLQPLSDPDGTRLLVGDGEVYNYRRLRRELERRGHVFRTRTDHESVFHLLEAAGLNALSRVSGWLAFVGTRADAGIFAARDTIGFAPRSWPDPRHQAGMGRDVT